MGVGLHFMAVALALLVGGGFSVRARAQAEPEPDGFYLVTNARGSSAAEPELDEASARGFLSEQGVLTARPFDTYAPEPHPQLSRAELSVFTEVEALLRAGRELSARFDERSALRKLSEAEQMLLERLHLPYVHAWLAEVYLAHALCALQLGETGLAETFLARAMSLDPSRKLLSAEASPQHVAWAQQLAREREQRPRSQFRIEVLLAAETPQDAHARGLRIFLDDRLLPSDARELSERSGSHILRIEAPGFVPYAALVELAAGRRQPLRVQLSRTPAAEAHRALADVRADAARARALAPLWVRRTGHPLWLFEQEAEKIAVYACRSECKAVAHLQTLETQALAPSPGEVGDAASRKAAEPRLFGATSNADVAVAGSPMPAKTRRFRHGKAWGAAAAIVAVGVGVALGVVLSREPTPTRERSLIVDPGQLPR